MKIYTTYFAKLKKMEQHFPYGLHIVSIANKDPSPSFYTNKYKGLVPPWYIVKAYKETGDKDQYIKDYKRLVLDTLDPHEVVKKLKSYAGYSDVALVCYEKSGDFCHRNLVAEWLRAAGYDVGEWNESKM